MTGYPFQQARPYQTGADPFDPNEVLQSGQRTQLGVLGLQLEQIKAQRAAESYALQKQVMASMSPKERLAFSFSPEQAGGALAKMLYPENKPTAVARGGALISPTGQLLYQAPYEAGGEVTWGPAAGPPGPGTNPATTGGPGSALANAMPQQPPPQQTASITSTPIPAPPPAPQPTYADIIQNRENRTGNPAQTNPRSSAMGNHQFIASTWLDMIKTHRPWLAEGKSDQEILALRADPTISADMAQKYADDNAPLLTNAGFETSVTNLAIMHGFGPTGGLRILQAERANPNQQLSSVLSKQVMRNHPELQGLTIAQGRALLERQLAGGSAQAATAAPTPTPAPPPGPAPTPAPTAATPAAAPAAGQAGPWQMAMKNGGPYTTGAKPGTFWMRRQVGVDASGKPIYETKTSDQVQAGGDKPPFAGDAIKAQAYNIVTDYQTRKARGEQLTPRDDFIYQLAVQELQKPDTVAGTDNEIRLVHPAPLPQMGGGAAAAPGATPAPTVTTPGATSATPGPRVETISPPRPKPTDEQNKNAGYRARMSAAAGIFDQLEAAGYGGPTEFQRQLTDKVPGYNRLVGAQGQQYMQAAREFINAQLRRESGAVISPDEFTNAYAQYLPVPGDEPETLIQKRQFRELAIKNMERSSGPAVDTVPNPTIQLPPVDQRVVGQTYDTPKGKAIWREGGWELVKPGA